VKRDFDDCIEIWIKLEAIISKNGLAAKCKKGIAFTAERCHGRLGGKEEACLAWLSDAGLLMEELARAGPKDIKRGPFSLRGTSKG